MDFLEWTKTHFFKQTYITQVKYERESWKETLIVLPPSWPQCCSETRELCFSFQYRGKENMHYHWDFNNIIWITITILYVFVIFDRFLPYYFISLSKLSIKTMHAMTCTPCMHAQHSRVSTDQSYTVASLILLWLWRYCVSNSVCFRCYYLFGVKRPINIFIENLKSCKDHKIRFNV